MTRDDVEGVTWPRALPVEVVLSDPGLPRQRNAALRATRHDCDVIVFFDDDFVPARNFLECVEQLFVADSSIAALTGELAFDGVHCGGRDLESVRALVREAEARPPSAALYDVNHLYGCNMAARLPMAALVGFDERLPLYAWQEDRDFSVRLRAYGRVVRAPALCGGHMGVSLGRTSGVRLGYSQVANPLYLLSKGTMQPMETTLFVGRNLVANLVKTFKPEPWVDRLGRLRGNLMALGDAARGHVAPERILDL